MTAVPRPLIPKRMKEMMGVVQSQRKARMETEFLLGADMTSLFRPGFCNKVVFMYCSSQFVNWLAGWSL